MKISALLICAMMTPGAALAACPDRSDLDKGIRFTLANGDTETFTTYGAHAVQSLYEAPDVPATRVLLGHGLYVLEWADVNDNGTLDTASRQVTAYPQKVSDMRLPEPGSVFELQAYMSDQSETWAEVHSYSVGQPERIFFGDCSYELVQVTIDYGGDSPLVETVHWLPELGLSYLSATRENTDVTVFEYSGIARVD